MENNLTMNIIKKLGWQFYLVNPYEHMYENVDDLPPGFYVNEVDIETNICHDL